MTIPPSRRMSSSSSTKDFKYYYSERLLIYHVGTSRIVFVGLLKAVGMLWFLFIATQLVGRAWRDDIESLSAGQLSVLILSGLFPITFTTLASRRYVLAIHVLLPPDARASPALLARYTRHPPAATTQLHISQFSTFGVPGQVVVPLRALACQRSRGHAGADLVVVGDGGTGARAGGRGRPAAPGSWRSGWGILAPRPKMFNVARGAGDVPVPTVWSEWLQRIEGHSTSTKG